MSHNKLIAPISLCLILVWMWGVREVTRANPNMPVSTSTAGLWVTFPSLSSSSLYDVSMISSTDGWAVGSNDTILHWDGTAWQPVASPAGTFNGVSMISSTDGWAVGWNGIIIHWDGTSWSSFASPTSNALFDIEMVSPTDGWAVGDSTILRWNGTNWQSIGSPVPDRLTAISMVSDTEGWIAGFNFDSILGSVLEWDGTSWSSVTIPSMPRLLAIETVSSPNDWIAVGENSVILRGTDLSGGKGTSQSITSVNGFTQSWLYSIDAVTSDDIWAVGGKDGSWILHWDGVDWTAVSNLGTKWLNAVDMVTETDGWAVGNEGIIMRYAPAKQVFLPLTLR